MWLLLNVIGAVIHETLLSGFGGIHVAIVAPNGASCLICFSKKSGKEYELLL